MSGPSEAPQVDAHGDGGDQAALSALLDDAAVDAAVRARRIARDGRERARQVATWVGALRDLAEREADVQVHTDADVAVVGRLIGVASDHLLLRLDGGALTVVARPATTGVRETDGAAAATPPAAGDRPAPTDQTLLEVLDRWHEDAATVHLVTRGGATERGRIVAVGEDVISLTTGAGTLHVPADAIVSVSVR
ncbi:hypothetical protein [Nitriliruptor alkaliphilus]|uniref:hypothetical protein n=1 Tax=Nitriliruptor alkaliphilus TaxID=427918 RepID=UPI0012EDD770|nr:hypothetical protein [Nitriliruptor alkaliphilus]